MRVRSRFAGLVLAGLLTPLLALASSHREAPAISFDPAADNTDLWAWIKPGAHDRLYIIAAYNPLEEPSGGPNFHKFSTTCSTRSMSSAASPAWPTSSPTRSGSGPSRSPASTSRT
jgi:hypothetical protein